jgi:hypothetical protein
VVLIGRRRWSGIWFGVAALGAAFGVVMVAGGAWAGWFLILVFLPSAVVLGMAQRAQANELVVDTTGFTIASVFRRTTTKWSDVERIGAVDLARHRERLVAIRLTARAAAGDPDAAAVAQAMDGYHRTLPMDYGVEADHLATLMRRYLDAARG